MTSDHPVQVSPSPFADDGVERVGALTSGGYRWLGKTFLVLMSHRVLVWLGALLSGPNSRFRYGCRSCFSFGRDVSQIRPVVARQSAALSSI